MATLYERATGQPEPDVHVHHRDGCDLDGRTDPHLHTQQEHRAHLDQAAPRGSK